MKQTLLITALALASATVQAQRVYPTVAISAIQTVSNANLAVCNDAPAHIGDTVKVQGIVITPGGQANSASGRQIWIREIGGQGPFQSLGIRSGSGTASSPNDLLTVVAGDTIEIAGFVQEFNGSGANPANDGETQIVPLNDQVTIIGVTPGPAPGPTQLSDVGVLNNAQRLNNLPSGEQWEGAYVKIDNVRVVSVNNFTAGTPAIARASFTVADAAGNQVEISDRFNAARFNGIGNQGFVVPAVGDIFTSISGIIIHSKNGCSGSGANNRGYTLNPFNSSDYVRGASAPSIGGITRLPVNACATTPTTISATITDDQTVASASLHYAIGESSTQYTTVPMTLQTGSIYSAAIPGQAEGTFVKYYISAKDNNNNVSNVPNVPASATTYPSAYVSRCNGPTIRDLQFTPFADGLSIYNNKQIDSVRGVVTSTASDLGQVFIQDPNATEWGGIWASGGASVATLNRGDRVVLTGIVNEYFSMTRLNVTSANRLGSGPEITPQVLAPNVLSAYDFAANEKYEGMLVKVQAPSGSLAVVDTNYLLTPTPNANNGEWRLGTDRFDPASGTVLQTGRQTTTNFSSLAVSYINNIKWATRDGNLTVPPVVVSLGDRFASATGLVYYGFNVLKLLPRNNTDLPNYITPVTLGGGGGSSWGWGMYVVPNPATGATIRVYWTPPSGGGGGSSLMSGGQSSSLGGGATTNGGGGYSCGCPPWKGVASYQVVNSVGASTGIQGDYITGNENITISSLASGLYKVIVTSTDGYYGSANFNVQH